MRDVIIYQIIGESSDQIQSYSGYKQRIVADSNRLSLELVSGIISAIEQLEKDLKSNLNYDTTLLHFVLMVREELNSAPRCRNQV